MGVRRSSHGPPMPQERHFAQPQNHHLSSCSRCGDGKLIRRVFLGSWSPRNDGLGAPPMRLVFFLIVTVILIFYNINVTYAKVIIWFSFRLK